MTILWTQRCVSRSSSRLEEQCAGQREEVQRLIREVEAREGAAGILRERISAQERDRERIAHELEKAQEGGGGMEKLIAGLRDRIAQETAEYEACRAELEKREQALADLAGELRPGLVLPGHWDLFADNPGDPEAFADYLDAKYSGRIPCRIPRYMEPILLKA